MVDTATPLHRADVGTSEDVSGRLLQSAAALSYDPMVEVDWDAPLAPDQFGLNPEWSTLYGTPLWDQMSEEQRVALTRHEVCSIMSTGIWFEMILQQMVLRDQYVKDPANSEFQFALTEIADECRHSIMFARACQKMGVPAYFPHRAVIELARGFKSLASAEVAYGGILVAEEVLDVMQRDWLRGANVLPVVRTTSKIHVLEESRHMKFARQEIRERMAGANALRKRASGTLIAIVAYAIVSSMVNKGVYAAVGLDAKEAQRQAAENEHHQTMLRSSCSHLMAFLSDVELLPRPAMAIYKRVNML
ncbi:MAG TPA: diiron oxygenase [Pseudonocardiaceae bacterium]|jgi:hypothetical protein|nr:diiron oxygenase [Pseudonocardiaceae bacterium]